MSTPPFEILEHPADIGFRAWGATQARLFEHAALALASLSYDAGAVAPWREYPLAAAAADDEALLVEWLSEVLFWHDARRVVFHHFTVTAIGGGRLHAAGYGEPWDPARHSVRMMVKAVTWHQLRVAQTPAGWSAEVYVDI